MVLSLGAKEMIHQWLILWILIMNDLNDRKFPVRCVFTLVGGQYVRRCCSINYCNVHDSGKVHGNFQIYKERFIIQRVNK